MVDPVYVTIGFKCADKDAFDAFWHDICIKYKFMESNEAVPTQAFAVSMGDMFKEQEAIDLIMESDLDHYEQLEMIGEVACCNDFPALFAKYEIDCPASLARTDQEPAHVR